ncbi:putative pentatricopeptide [Rosa chinensis]|uniref:Putative pentatricopeptide n=1 Tax=Rosa chinensis TaxID=74649 RepID=A0A2P6SDJ5_ROSCH|nr:putative pentatricopeptide [Rosa chinensis]
MDWFTREMPAMGFVPNVVTFTTNLGGYVSRHDMVGAKRVFGEILDRGWFPDGKLVEAIKVMDEMEDNGVGANEVTYGVMIEAYCKEKKSGEAVNLLDDMVEKRYIPSSALCCKVIDVLCCEGKVEDACELWKRLLKKNCTPDNAVLGTLIYWLCKKGEMWEARKLFDQIEMSEPPDVMTDNVLISGMCEVGSCVRLGGCRMTWWRKDEGIRILDEMFEKGCLPNKSTYAMLIEGLCDSGEEAEITRVISMAMSSGDIDSDSWDLFLTKVVGDLDTGESVLNRILLENAD